MSKISIKKTTCGLCQAGCGLLIHLENGSIVKLAGDPESPINKGVICSKAAESLSYCNDPSRLKYPLRRVGNRGSGRWERITWAEALNNIADEFNKFKGLFGPESLVFIHGSFKGGYEGAYLSRFANVFGSPNIASMAPLCFIPRVYSSVITHGYNPMIDYENQPKCIMIWGMNPIETRVGEYGYIQKALQKGSKLIVVDPRRINLVDDATIWVRLRPGSDLVLALALINVIIEEQLYDKTFVEKWTVGFAELQSHVINYTPEFAEEVTWVKASLIRETARLYATIKPAVIQCGNAIDHTQNNFQTARAVSILRAITGNLGIPGGELCCSAPHVVPMASPDLDLRDKIPALIRERRLSNKEKLLPIAFYTLPQSITDAILNGDPYPLHAAYIMGANLLLTYPNARRVHEALKKIDFLIAADMFMTPTAALADIVLPAAGYLEFDGIVMPPYYYPVCQVQQKFLQIGECRSDYDILQDLAGRMGFGSDFWNSEQDCLNYILKPAGITFQEFKEIGRLEGQKEYRKQERDQFATPSGKVELFSERLATWGYDPLPAYHEPPETPLSAPEMTEEFPFIMTSWKTEIYRHSAGRQVSSFRNRHPRPFVWIHPETAGKLGIKDGDRTYIETKRGKIVQEAKITSEIDPRVIGVDYAWWFPESGQEKLYGWEEANINILTNDGLPRGREMGTPNLRGILCKVYK
jgi:anaerobic selenocysteine-containing dehydrogenase